MIARDEEVVVAEAVAVEEFAIKFCAEAADAAPGCAWWGAVDGVDPDRDAGDGSGMGMAASSKVACLSTAVTASAASPNAG